MVETQVFFLHLRHALSEFSNRLPSHLQNSWLGARWLRILSVSLTAKRSKGMQAFQEPKMMMLTVFPIWYKLSHSLPIKTTQSWILHTWEKFQAQATSFLFMSALEDPQIWRYSTFRRKDKLRRFTLLKKLLEVFSKNRQAREILSILYIIIQIYPSAINDNILQKSCWRRRYDL